MGGGGALEALGWMRSGGTARGRGAAPREGLLVDGGVAAAGGDDDVGGERDVQLRGEVAQLQVIASSSRVGVGSPLGWLWARTKLWAAMSSAVRRTVARPMPMQRASSEPRARPQPQRER
ncbi:hypothetical protein BE04_26475 [Sorangium cellulosum]|uniref:Uncharacterized protein n=1 Tax=Sorangium cellulosum TaxID=56 RepID=A0A150PVT0_SORCE|nr:hypothetical protein BE04_26475 [Sorangium cellulosum]